MIIVCISKCDAPGGRREKAISERAQARRKLFEVLSERFGLEPKEILKAESGKPYFADWSYPAFSISHTDGAVAVVVSDENPSVGIDIEKFSERLRNTKLTDRFFPSLSVGENEISDITFVLDEGAELLEAGGEPVLIFTLGEAVVKCNGGGFSVSSAAAALSSGMKKSTYVVRMGEDKYALSVAVVKKES